MKKLFLLLVPYCIYAHEYTEMINDYVQLAQQYAKNNEHEKAYMCYQEIERLEKNVLQSQAQDINTLFEQAITCYKNSNYAAAIYHLKNAAEIDPDNSSAQLNIGRLEQELQHYTRAIAAYKKTANIDPSLESIYSGLGYCYSILGDLTTAWKYWRIWQSLENKKTDKIKPLWKGENLKGKRIIIEDEGGYGDLFQWIRYAALFKQQGATVILEARPEIIPIIRSCTSLDTILEKGSALPEYDFYIPLGRIHSTFNTSLTTIPCPIPYLYADKHLVKTWSTGFDDTTSFKIGICWAAQNYVDSDTGKPIINTRSIPLKILAQLSTQENISLYSLQCGPAAQDPSAIEHSSIRTSGQLDIHGKFMDTAAIMEHLDLIITIDTSIAHLAGALGKKVWVLLPYKADWRWMLDRSDSPWYPTMRLFRQTKQGDWQTVIDQVFRALVNELDKKKDQISDHIVITNDAKELFVCASNFFEQGNLNKALELFKQLLKTYPNDPALIHNTACTLRRLNMLDESIQFYKKVLLLQPQHKEASFGLAQSYLASGLDEQGWALFNDWRQEIKQNIPPLETLHNKRIIITAEWGLGDMFFLIRYTQLLKNCNNHITVQVSKELEHILNLCPYIDQVIPLDKPLPTTGIKIPLFYLPTLFKTSKETIPAQVPYLYADERLTHDWKKRIEKDSQFKIGICWDIGHHDTKCVGWQRSMPLMELLPLDSVIGISLYSLQKNGSNSIKQLNDNVTIHDFSPHFDKEHGGFMDTAALIKNLDLIITVDTAVAHLAGGLGKETWLMLPYSPDYRWTLHGQTTPWYPTMRIFRQKKPGQWYPVVQQIVKELKIRLKKKK